MFQDPRPIPQSKEQCFSPEYVSTVVNFTTNNYNRIERVYREASVANPQCDFFPFVQIVEKIASVAGEWKSFLEEPNPTFKELEGPYNQMFDLVATTNDIVRKRVLGGGEKACYATPRRLRLAPTIIANYVLQIITKCVQFVDAKNSFC